MAAKLKLVYGFITDPSLNIIDFDGKLIYFDHQTEVFGVLIESKAPNEFIEVGQIDEDEWQEKYDAYLLTVIAAVAEVEGDLVTPTQRIRWEKKFRARKPKLMVGLSE